MAKATRKRKPNAGSSNAIMRKEIESIITRAYQHVLFLGDSVNPLTARNIEILFTHLRGVKHEIGMESFLKHIQREMDWSLGVACYFRVGEEYKCISSTAVIESLPMVGLEQCLEEVLLNNINILIEGADHDCTQENFVFYGYFLEPEVSPNLKTKADGIMDLFINVYDFEKLKPFGEELSSPIFNIQTPILNAIKNARTFPKVNQVRFLGTDMEVFS